MAARLPAPYRARVLGFWQELGISPRLVKARRLPVHVEAQRLQPIGLGTDGRDKLLVPGAAIAWSAMRMAAGDDGIGLLMVSAFRSIDYQASLIRAKLAKGRTIDEILTVNAPPGCSEHHTGRAVDIGEAGCPPLEEAFDQTEAFRWLTANAARYGFTMTYPKGNAEGYLYEPWHWCWKKIGDSEQGGALATEAAVPIDQSTTTSEKSLA
ncbi:MAG: M15 family metallopeptidase [Gammaproteobacteria bacterium]|uniref:M15 family metallopeptidase n=1 Tax=Nevskia sp. TaxID=1929292 RepID=UPI00403748A5|nr:M15 family metallopeptidase [Gammaproteobacteria bacterium]